MILKRPIRIFLSGLVAGLFVLGGGGAGAYAQPGPQGWWGAGSTAGGGSLGTSTTALFTNPSHLTAGTSGPSIELRVFDLRAGVGGDLLQFNHYGDTFGDGAGTLTNSEEAQVLDEWFGDARRDVATYTEITPFALTYRPAGRSWAIGFGIRGRVRSEAKMDRGLFDLLVVGADSNRTLPLGGGQRTLSTVDLTGAFSYTFESIPVSVGVAPRFIMGTQYADATLDSEVTIRDSLWTHEYAWTARAAGGISQAVYDEVSAFQPNPLGGVSGLGNHGIAGMGGALNLGATYAVEPNFLVSLSLTDLGLIRWSQDAQTISNDDIFQFDGFELDVDRLQNEFNGDVGAYAEHQADSLARAAYGDVERERTSFTTHLPAALHVGTTWAQEQLTLTSGATVGLQGTAGTVRAAPTAHLGGEYRLGPIPLRLGVQVGGSQAVTLAGGLGVHTGGYRFDFGVRATPSTSTLGQGGHYALQMSLGTVRF